MSAIAVAGMACRYPDADSPDELWESVLSQRRAFRRLPQERLRAEDYFSLDADEDRTYSLQAAVLDGWRFDRVRFRISGSTFRSTDLAHWLALDVAAAALADAGYPDGAGIPRERTLVVVGNTLTGEFSRAATLRLRWPYVRRVVGSALARDGWSEGQRGRFLDRLEREYKAPFAAVDEDTLAGGLSNTIAGRICNTFDFKGGGYTVDGACAASLLAVATAAASLARGEADVALAGGVDLSLDPFELVGFAKAGALAHDEMRVYDARPEGFWPGEGCGFVVLRRLDDALAEGRDVTVAVRGWGVASDGTGGITRPEVDGQLLALRRAYERAGFGIDTVAFFEGHGTGTSVGDATELATLTQARREAGGTRPAAIGSVKANIGHTKAAAGVAGLIKAALALREEVVPPTTGCVEPHPALADGEPPQLRIVRAAEAWPPDGAVRAGVSAMGFGGIDTHVVLERVAPRRRRPAAPVPRLSDSWQDAELFLFAGSKREVASAVEAVRREAGALSFAELADVAAALEKRLPAPRADVRAAVVATRPAELEAALAELAATLAGGEGTRIDAAAGVAVSNRSSPPRVGYLFTGQGSPVSRDGGALARRFAFVRTLFEGAAFAEARDLVDTAVAQPAIVTASLAGLELLRRLGVDADVAVGHSLGELTALHWAGAIAAADAVAVAAARGRAMSDLGEGRGAMASVATDAAAAERLVAATGAVVAALNGPHQTVVSGSEAAVAAVTSRAERAGIRVTRLRVSHAFHSPLVAAAAAPLRETLERVPLRTVDRRVVSTVTGGELTAEEDVAAVLVRQVTSAVLFAQALARAAGDVDVLVEIGPGRSLETLAREQVEVPVLALDAGGPSLRPPLLAAGALFALGAPIDLDVLFGRRFTRPFQLGRPRRFLANPCEAAPVLEPGAGGERAPAAPPATVATERDAGGSALEVVRGLVARRAELPADAVTAGARLLGDLHLSSIAVAEIAAAAARSLGTAPPEAPSELATATVGELADALARLAATGPEPAATLPAGVASWLRAYERVLVERPRETAERTATRWHVVGAPGDALSAEVRRAFAGEGAEDGVVVVLTADARCAAPDLLLEAARVARERRAHRFVVVQDGELGAAFARVIHLELGTTTCVARVADGMSLAAAREEAESARGYREIALVGARRLAPIWRPLELTPGGWPLESGDVVLVTGGGKGIGAECALALARRRGLALALVGRADPRSDPALAANLERMEAAGIRVLYLRADLRDGAAVRAAVAEAERALGPVAGILHAAGVNRPALLPDVDANELRETLGPKVDGFRHVLGAVDVEKLRLVVTFGSVIARIGLAGEAHYALANEWLGDELAQFARTAAECRCVNVEWSVWAGVGMGERLGTVEALARAGVTPIPVADGVRLLEDIIRTDGLPTSVVATGRFGLPPTVELERTPLPLLRFVESPLLEYPGVELVVEAELSAPADPYVCDHEFDGVPLLPAVVGLEGMAQVAAPLLGTEQPPAFEDVELTRPVTVPPDAPRRIRLAALRARDGSVDVVLRSDETAFGVDHFRARLRPQRGAVGGGAAPGPAAGAFVPLAPDEVYETLLFHGPRFRRVRGYRALTAKACVADIDARPGERWFGDLLPQRLLLGDPGARDAAVHALQAAIPHARVLPVAVRRISPIRRPEGVLRLSACERASDDARFVWDLDLHDDAGRLCERWEGLELRRVATGPPPSSWPSALLAPYLERRLAGIVGADVRVVLAARAGARRPGSANAALAAAAGTAEIVRRPDGKPEAPNGGVSAAHLDGYTLAVAAPVAVTCDVEEAAGRGEAAWLDLLGSDRLALASRIASDVGEALDRSATRVWATTECVRKAGRPGREPLALVRAYDDGWTLLQAGGSRAATYVTELRNVDGPVAFAFLVQGAE